MCPLLCAPFPFFSSPECPHPLLFPLGPAHFILAAYLSPGSHICPSEGVIHSFHYSHDKLGAYLLRQIYVH
jgi:hypothetical protein